MSTTLDTVRRLVGRRSKISRDEMVAILVALDIPPEASTITGRYADGALHVADARVEPVREDRPDVPPHARPIDQAATRAAEVEATAKAWAALCEGILCVSVLPGSYWLGDALTSGLTVRYDQPGSMRPMQVADLMFCAEAMGRGEYDPIGYLRRHARRLLIVRGAPMPEGNDT